MICHLCVLPESSSALGPLPCPARRLFLGFMRKPVRCCSLSSFKSKNMLSRSAWRSSRRTASFGGKEMTAATRSAKVGKLKQVAPWSPPSSLSGEQLGQDFVLRCVGVSKQEKHPAASFHCCTMLLLVRDRHKRFLFILYKDFHRSCLPKPWELTRGCFNCAFVKCSLEHLLVVQEDDLALQGASIHLSFLYSDI